MTSKTTTTYHTGYSYSHGWSVFQDRADWNITYALEPVASGYPSREDADAETCRLNLGDGYMKEGASR